MEKTDALLKSKRFLPLFITQFLGAFNDNVYKNGLVILITYSLSTSLAIPAEILITIAAGVFILPFFLFSTLAGQLSDKFEKSRLIRYTKIAELMLMCLVSVGFYFNHVIFLISLLFFIGAQATFFGPMKYAILPEHLAPQELMAGNALIEASTYLAILLGTLLGGLLASQPHGTRALALTMVILAAAGVVSSYAIPRTTRSAPSLSIQWNLLTATHTLVYAAFQHRHIRIAVIGISWFWLIGATYLSQFPTYVKKILHAEPTIVTLFLTCFTAGIGVGALLCNYLTKHFSYKKIVISAAVGLTIVGLDFVLASQIPSRTNTLMTLKDFLHSLQHWRLLLDLFLLSICGGIYAVPLYVILQQETEPTMRSRAIAVNNIFNALFMVFAALITSAMLYFRFTVVHVFGTVTLANMGMTGVLLRWRH